MTREEAKKLLPIIKAYAEGKTIESRCIKGDTSLWYDDKDPNFDDDFEYRIKPEKVEDIKNIGLCPNDEDIRDMKNDDVMMLGWILGLLIFIAIAVSVILR